MEIGIDMRGFKVIYKERVYNALGIVEWESKMPPDIDVRENGIAKPKDLTVAVINEDGEVLMIYDEAFMFQFIRSTN